MIDIMISGLLSQAEKLNSADKRSSPNVRHDIIFITPQGNIKTLGVDRKADFADYINEHAEDITVGVRMQPSVYVNSLIPNRDNLKAQLITTNGKTNTVIEYTAIPLDPGDPKAAGTHSQVADLEGASTIGIKSYEFQLIDPTYTVLRDQIVSGISLMGNIEDTMSSMIDSYTKQYVGDDLPYDGIVMESPIDNDQRYSAIVVPEGVPLVDFPSFLQESEKYGVYSKGLGFFFKQGRWWLYSLYDPFRYDRHPNPVNIFRLPQDKAPTLESTFFFNNNGMTILATGESDYDDQGDIAKQDGGVGVRLILGSKVSGETGSYYNAGRSIQTRADSMSEFQISERASGNNYTPVRRTPTSNPYKYASANSANEGTILTVEWHNSDTGYIEPGVPCRYQYMDKENMVTRKGVILGYRTDYKVLEPNSLLMKRSTMLTIFLGRE